LTAEAIAEMLHKPLYVVSMGELGTTPESLEARLQDIFDLCVPWQALVLIDEAETLLERRSKNDIVRNAMVCVMLRLLEYYSGILFLTTNRVEFIDPAFQSRVTCALWYDPLTVEARAQIWTTMLRQLEIDITTIDVDELAHADINGRQIKNTLQLAAALARHDQVPVGQAHLRETLAVTTSFLRETTNGASTAVEL
jgi:SpoVK/Ycf46/Vps4 family AAA+-type ATPase